MHLVILTIIPVGKYKHMLDTILAKKNTRQDFYYMLSCFSLAKAIS